MRILIKTTVCDSPLMFYYLTVCCIRKEQETSMKLPATLLTVFLLELVPLATATTSAPIFRAEQGTFLYQDRIITKSCECEEPTFIICLQGQNIRLMTVLILLN